MYSRLNALYMYRILRLQYLSLFEVSVICTAMHCDWISRLMHRSDVNQYFFYKLYVLVNISISHILILERINMTRVIVEICDISTFISLRDQIFQF